jgi:hypothetical protein
MFAGLSIQTYGFAAKALGDGNTRFAFDDGRRVIVRRDRMVGNDVSLDYNDIHD